MPKFRLGDKIEADRSKASAIITKIDHAAGTYTVKYIDKGYSGELTYKCEEVDRYWSLCSLKSVNNKQCTCGCWKTYGKNAPKSFHSDYCDLA